MEDLMLSAEACEVLVRELGDRIVAVALFGSRARDEPSERSDFDFFVVVRNFNDRDRRFKIYHRLHSVVKRDVTVIDVDEAELFREGLEIKPPPAQHRVGLNDTLRSR
jgi:predicted nucleotidyltransferase